jgi:probable rRNA maturation factor
MDAQPAVLEIEISDTQGHVHADRAALARLARNVLHAQGISHASVSITLVDDRAIHELNRRHLGHDWPTDVISFRLSDDGAPALYGELIVSAEMAANTARGCDAEPWAELCLYVVHGLLHLCGMDDMTPAAAAAMRLREAEMLAHEGLPNTFVLAGRTTSSHAEPEVAPWSC